MAHDYHIGQQVVCVGRFKPSEHPMIYPEVGGIYTIRGFQDTLKDDELIFIWLEEIVNPPVEWENGTYEPSFDLRGFRPVRKTDISVFTEMLNPTKVEEKV